LTGHKVKNKILQKNIKTPTITSTCS
jgi:hypothetical protein